MNALREVNARREAELRSKFMFKLLTTVIIVH